MLAGRPQMVDRARAASVSAVALRQWCASIDRFADHPLPAIFGYLASPTVADELVQVARTERADAVIIDAMFSAVLEAAAAFGRPTAVALHTLLRRIYPTWRANFARQSAARVAAGFAPLPSLEVLWGTRDLVQVNTLAAFDTPGATPLSNVRHGAPVLYEEPASVPARLPWAADDPRPLVLVSFSTVFEQRSAPSLQHALDALAALPVRVVATTGGVLAPEEIAPPHNALVLGCVSHGALMERAALVVTHGGHGTAMRSLRHGLPMVCIPALAEDQPLIASALQERGAGIALAREPAIADIRDAVRKILDTPDYTQAARHWVAALAATQGADCAADSFEQLAG